MRRKGLKNKREQRTMDKKRIATAFSLCVMLLTACADSTDSVESCESAPTETMGTSAASTAPKSTASMETVRITAEAISYKDGSLTFAYEGKEYTLPAQPDKFVNSSYHLTDIGINEKIINNPYGIKITADIEITKDMSEIVKCDVETKNASFAENDRNAAYYMHHHEGSVYTISSDTESYHIDLGGLDNRYKDIAPEDTEVTFYGVVMDGDKLVTDNIGQVTKTEINEQGEIEGKTYIPLDNSLKYHYCGIVQSVDADMAVVKLNYKDKELTVPRYLTDGEIVEGAQVIIVLRDTPEEIISSQERERDFAVFYTDPKLLLTEEEEFERVAYCKEKDIGGYDVTMTDGTED